MARRPDFGSMSADARADWFRDRLREQPGTRSTDESGVWLELEFHGALWQRMQEIAPGLTPDQCKLSNRKLGQRKERVSISLGRGRYRHSVLLESGTAPAAEQEQSVPAADRPSADATVSDELPANTDPAPTEAIPLGRAAREEDLCKVAELLAAAVEEIERLRRRNRELEEALVQRDQTIVALKEERRDELQKIHAARQVEANVAALKELLND